ncbi:MAG: Spore maturation protein B [Firmicutes bacterium]|nr:Spore maturation protein B [candidate division NPL-UPA2 bacterium]MBT9153471.1 Spore maturation protein B [candidate division NPL-UPA2 bacterium]
MVLLVCVIIVLAGMLRRVPVFDEFVEGAKGGALLSLRFFPFILAMLMPVNDLSASGLLGSLVEHLGACVELFGVPREIVPLALLRPLTGSGSLALTGEILRVHGPDSFLGLLASTVQGSTDTTLYVVTVYFGAVRVRRIRHSLLTGLIADLAGLVAAILVSRHLFDAG